MEPHTILHHMKRSFGRGAAHEPMGTCFDSAGMAPVSQDLRGQLYIEIQSLQKSVGYLMLHI